MDSLNLYDTCATKEKCSAVTKNDKNLNYIFCIYKTGQTQHTELVLLFKRYARLKNKGSDGTAL